MSVAVDDLHHADDHADEEDLDHTTRLHITVGGYVTGFVLSVILTAIPFWLVMAQGVRKSTVTTLRHPRASPWCRSTCTWSTSCT